MPENNEEIIADFNIETTNIEGDCEVNTSDKFEFNIDINATPEKTSQLINDGDGESPFVTENNIQTPENSVIEVIKENNVITIKSTTFVFEQALAANTWIIQHNLNKKPSVFAVDSLGRVVLPNEIEYNDENQITLYFIAEFTGKAYLN